MAMSQSMPAQVSGDVSIDPTAAIASDVLLLADPKSRIVIGAGVSIGSGSIIHAHRGLIAVDEGANIASEVLIVGKGKIGRGARIGPGTTIFNSSVEPDQIITAGSLLGDSGRQSEMANGRNPHASTPTVAPPEEADRLDEPAKPVVNTTLTRTTAVYGRVHIERMLNTLLPNRRSSDS